MAFLEYNWKLAQSWSFGSLSLGRNFIQNVTLSVLKLEFFYCLICYDYDRMIVT